MGSRIGLILVLLLAGASLAEAQTRVVVLQYEGSSVVPTRESLERLGRAMRLTAPARVVDLTSPPVCVDDERVRTLTQRRRAWLAERVRRHPDAWAEFDGEVNCDFERDEGPRWRASVWTLPAH